MRMPSHVARRSGRYYIRLRVPDYLRPIVGRGEIHRSLGTSDPAVARLRAPAALDMLMRGLEAARLTGENEIELIRARIAVAEAETEAKRAEATRLVAATDEVRALASGAKALETAALDRAREVVRKAGAIATTWHAEAVRERSISSALLAHPPAAPVAGRPRLAAGAELPFWRHTDEYLKAAAVAQKTAWSYRRAFTLLREVVKEKAIGAVDDVDIDSFHKHVVASGQPKHGRATLARASVGKNLSHIKASSTGQRIGNSSLPIRQPISSRRARRGRREALLKRRHLTMKN